LYRGFETREGKDEKEQSKKKKLKKEWVFPRLSLGLNRNGMNRLVDH